MERLARGAARPEGSGALKISVAMTTYNGERFLREQLDSLVAQDRRPDEVVINDDRSSDGTLAVVEAFRREAPFEVSVQINDRNLGYTQNFGAALARTTGDIVFLCDQDDRWLPGKIARIVRAFEEDPAAHCVLTDAVFTDGELNPVGKTKIARIRELGLPPTEFVMGCCAAFRREFLDLWLPIPAAVHGHDNWLVKAADVLGAARRLEEPLQLYRRHGESVSKVPINSMAAPPSAVDRLRAQLGNLFSTAKLEREHAMYANLLERLARIPDGSTVFPGAAEGRRVIAARAERLEARTRLLARPATMRLPAWSGLVLSGAYRDQGGVRVALKDLLTPARLR